MGRQQIALAIVLGAVVGGLATAVGMNSLRTDDDDRPNVVDVILPTSGMAELDRYACPAGTTKRVQIGGVEDHFDARNFEPARFSDGLSAMTAHVDRFARMGQARGARAYDEFGSAKHHYDWFDVPAGLRGGTFVLRVDGGPEATRDGLGVYVDQALPRVDSDRVGRRLAANMVAGAARLSVTGPTLGTNTLSPETRLVSVDLSDMRTLNFDTQTTEPLLDYVDRHLPGRPAMRLSTVIGDATAVDFIGLATCHGNPVPHGTSWASSNILEPATGLHAMSCNYDVSQPLCDPVGGDTACDTALPLACHREGNAMPPTSEIAALQARIEGNFDGGTIRLTDPLRGDSLATREAADNLCAETFGPDWRILDYYVAGGEVALTQSELPHGERAWVDVPGTPTATCWAEP